jgi:D-aminopeptidase
MSHTESPNPQLIINGRLCGETTLNAGLADFLGVRTLLVTGDNLVTHEVESNFGGIHCVEVKVSRSRAHCISIAPDTAHKTIEEAARKAASDRASRWPLKILPPYDCELTFPSEEFAKAAGIIPGATLAGSAVSFRTSSFEEVVRFVDTACDLGRYLLMQQMTARLKDTAADLINAGRREIIEKLFAA